MKSEVLNQYIDVCSQIKQLEEKKRQLAKEIEQKMDFEGVDKYKGDYGTFTRMRRKKWTYSAEVQMMVDDVAKKRKVEELEGVAQCEEVSSIVFRPAKK